MPAYCGLLPSPLKLTAWLQSLPSTWAPLPMMGDAGVEGSLLCFGLWGPSVSAKRDQGITIHREDGSLEMETERRLSVLSKPGDINGEHTTHSGL